MRLPVHIVVLGATLLAAPGGRSQQVQPTLLNGFAAVVNDKIITLAEVKNSIPRERIEEAQARFRADSQAYREYRAQLERETLVALVERELILHDFETSGKYQLPDVIIEQQIKDRIRRQFGDRATLIRTLRDRGMSYETFKRQERERFIVRSMEAMNVHSEVLVSPFKIESYYQEHQRDYQVGDQVRLRVIVLAYKPERDREATRQLADQLHARLEAGEGFKELAATYTDYARRDAGDIGWVDRGSRGPELDKVAFALKAGQFSEVIQTDEACWILLAEETRSARTRSLTEVRDEIEQILQDREQQRLRKAWIERLQKKAHVRYFYQF